MSMDKYEQMFYVVDNDDIICPMDNMCNSVVYSDPKYLLCYHINKDDKTEELIMMIPHDNVSRVYRPKKFVDILGGRDD